MYLSTSCPKHTMEECVVGSIREPLLEPRQKLRGSSRSFTALNVDTTVPIDSDQRRSKFPFSAGPLGRHFTVPPKTALKNDVEEIDEEDEEQETFSPPRIVIVSPSHSRRNGRPPGTRVPNPQSGCAGGVRHYTRKLGVLEVLGGKAKRREFQTPELLREVHCHNKWDRLEDGAAGCLKLRDLRQVCTAATVGSQRASIEPRRNCILVNMPPFVRCIILHDRVYFILKSVQDLDLMNNALQSEPPETEFCETRQRWLPNFFSTNRRERRQTFEQLAFERRRGANHVRAIDSCRSDRSDGSFRGTGFWEDEDDVQSRLETALFEKVRQLTDIRTRSPLEFAVLESILVEVSGW
eukprot:Polyplicarium_translucidae@DN3364_c0_g3_i27.p1